MSDLFRAFERGRSPVLAPGAQSAYRDSLKPLRRYFVDEAGDVPARHISRAHIGACLAWRRTHPMRGTQLNERTLEKDRAVLHRIFAHAVELEWREGNPVTSTEKPKRLTREPAILSTTEYDKLLKACGEDARLPLYLLVLGEAGLRCESEALWLQWEDIDLGAGVLTVRSGRDGDRTKNARSRRIPLTPRLVTAMREHFASHRFSLYLGQAHPGCFTTCLHAGTRWPAIGSAD